jgi:hypothetical protein
MDTLHLVIDDDPRACRLLRLQLTRAVEDQAVRRYKSSDRIFYAMPRQVDGMLFRATERIEDCFPNVRRRQRLGALI